MSLVGGVGHAFWACSKERWTRSGRPRLRQLPQAAAGMLAPNDVVTFVEPGDQHSAEVDRPNAIVDFLKTNRVWREGVGDEEQPLLEAEGAALVMRLTRKCPGYSIGRSRASYAR